MDMVKNKKVKPSAVYEFLDFDDGFQNAGIYGAEVYRSDDGGTTWKKMNKKYLTLYSTYGYYFGKIFISPVNENKLIITGVSIQLSTDGGKTFNNIDQRNTHGDSLLLHLRAADHGPQRLRRAARPVCGVTEGADHPGRAPASRAHRPGTRPKHLRCLGIKGWVRRRSCAAAPGTWLASRATVSFINCISKRWQWR